MIGRFWLLGSALMLAGCGDQAALDGLPTVARGRVVQVVAGDTVVLSPDRLVKLAGVAAPHGDAPATQDAQDRLSALVLGKQVELLSAGAGRDRFDRETAQLRVGRTWVQGQLLADGWVRVRTFRETAALADRMLRLEAKARSRERGLWRLSAYRVRLPSETAGGDGFQVIEGRVGAVRFYSGETVLRLGPVEAIVPAAALNAFEAAQKPPDLLAGRLVRVRGGLHAGRLRLDHPQALEVLSDP